MADKKKAPEKTEKTEKKQGTSLFIYLMFCLLIAIFVINFGPQGGGKGGGGCTGDDNSIIRVDGKEVSQTAYHIAYANPYNRGQGKQHTHIALEMLIRREILAQEAEKHGISVNSDLIQEEIKKGHFYIGGQVAQIPGIFDEDGLWRIQAFKNWIGQLNVSRNSYVGEQQRAMQASLMAKMLLDSVQVSRDEALSHFLFEGNTVQYDVVAFRPENYKSSMKLTDADLDRFVASHGAEVEARYKADERTYKAVKPQLKLRQIFIAKLEEPAAPPPAPEQGSAAGSAAPAGAGSGAGSAAVTPPKKDDKVAEKPAAKPIGMKIDEAKAKLEAVRTAVAAGKQKFEDAAKQLSTDENFKANGGAVGWRPADSASLGEKAVSDAVKTLKPGEMTPVIATDKGVWLVIAEEKREGDLSFDQVKREIAKDLALDTWSKEAAKRAALAALDKARNGVGLNLDQMYEKEKAPETPGVDIQQILNDPNLTDEQRQRLLQMMMQGQKSGQIVVESKDIPAAWYAQADGASGSAAKGSAAPAAPAAKGSAAPAAPAAAGSAAPAAKGSAAPAAGSAAPAAGSGAGSAAAAPTATPAAPAVPATPDVTPSADKLPEFGNVEPPHVARFGPAPRTSTMSGIGSAKDAINSLFDELSPGMLAKKVYEGDGAFYVMQLITRADPKVEDFDKEADRLIEELRKERAQAFLEGWMKDRCESLAKDNRITANPGLLRETDDQGKLLPTTYRYCMSFQR